MLAAIKVYKQGIGRAIRRARVMPVGWIAEVLMMGDPKRTTKQVQSDRFLNGAQSGRRRNSCWLPSRG